MPLSRRVLAAAAVSAIAAAALCVHARADTPSAIHIERAPTTVDAPTPATLRAYDIAEFAVHLPPGSDYANPFDPDEIAVDAAFTGPHGESIHLPAFWYGPFERAKTPDKNGRIDVFNIETRDGAGWRVRVAPPVPGTWRLVVTAKDKNGVRTSAPFPFTVAPGKSEGFARRATGAGRERYFQLDDGKPFFLIGENVCWAGRRGLADYDDWFPALAHAGGNYARLWMAWAPLEDKGTGLGRYNLHNAAYFDQVLKEAEDNGLRCMVAIDTFGSLSTGGYFNEGQWARNPYNAANGGPVPSSDSKIFFTNPTARKLYRQRLRYIVGRYSAFTSVGFWEFWNEQDGPGPWFAEMSDYLHAIDGHHHLITNSFSTTGTADVWNVPGIDLTQTHRYGDNGSIRDIAQGLPADNRDHEKYHKPHLLGEFGIAYQRGDENYDPSGIGTNMHNGLWGSALSGNAGGGALWWWDGYVAPKNLYREFTGLANFTKGTDWPRRAFQQISLPTPTAPPHGPETFSDITLTPATGWGAKSAGPVVLGRDGEPRGTGTVIGFLYGPEKPQERSVLAFDVDLPHPTTLTLHLATVSNHATLRVAVDGQTTAEFPLDAAPGKGSDFESTKQFPEYGGIYQAVFNKDRTVSLPEGKHEVTIENTSGDWAQISSYRFGGALSSRYVRLRPYALQDAATGETLVWLEDPDSNWINDRDGKFPGPQSGVRLAVPLPKTGRYRAEWWDTRKGVIVGRETVMAAKAGADVTLAAPTFARDIALRVAPVR